MNVMDKIINEQCRKDIPEFKVGDTIKVYTKIIEGETERVQLFTGVVIAFKGTGIGKYVTIRRVTSGQGVERVIPLNSPRIEKIEIERKGRVRRAKLYYLRTKIGKASRVKEMRINS